MRFRHNLKIKPHVTRKASSFSSQRLRSHWSLNAWKSAKRGLQYDPYKRSRWRYAPLFHDSTRLVDSFTRLTGLTLAEIEDRYDSLPDILAEGQADNRMYSFGPNEYTFSVATPSIARVPAKIRSTKYLVAPPSPVVQPAGVHNQYLQFNSPRQVLTCVRRHQRREVLFALNRAGGGHKRPKWRDDSYIRC